MTQVSGIEKRLSERAESELRQHVNNAIEEVMGFLRTATKSIYIDVEQLAGKNQSPSASQLLRAIGDAIVADKLPGAINQHITDFMVKVDSLQEQVNELRETVRS
jgi:hypothetical protein